MAFAHLSPLLRSIVDCQLTVSPSHRAFLERRFEDLSSEEARVLDGLAEMISKIVGEELATWCEDYDWLTARMLEEEIHFRRTGSYRLSSFEEASAQVYHDPDFMKRYMNGVLLTQLFWSNHSGIYGFFLSGLLARGHANSTFLEIGPGHGLYLAGAARHASVSHAVGWDISATSIQETARALRCLEVTAELQQRDLLKLSGGQPQFDLIVCSEVLEHLEDPTAPLKNLCQLLNPDGFIFVHVPVNSPAPDHLYLWRTPEAAVEFVQDCGLQIVEQQFHPVTNTSLSRARRHNLTVSVGVVAQRAA